MCGYSVFFMFRFSGPKIVYKIWTQTRNYIGIAVLLYYTLSSTRSAGLFATNKAKPSIAQRSTVRRKYWQMHADILPDFDLAIQPRFTAENVNKSLPPFLYSSLVFVVTLLLLTGKSAGQCGHKVYVIR